MAKQKRKIMLWLAIILLIIELVCIVVFFDMIVVLFSQNWWKSLTALVAGVSIRALILNIALFSVIERSKLHFIEEIIERSVKKVWFRKTKCVTIKTKRDLKQRWTRYSKLEKIVIITGFMGITLAGIGFILYMPLGKKHTLKLAQKKFGGAILKRAIERQKIITAIEFVYVILRKIRREEKKEEKN